jgi:hypothetical protein
MNKMRFLMPIGFLAVAAGFSVAVMLLWNWLMPSLFGLMTISFWQALGILVLCRLLFGSFGGWHRGMRGGRGGGRHGANRVREFWTKMTPEQRKEFINKRREHFGRGGFFDRPDFDTFTTEESTSKENE